MRHIYLNLTEAEENRVIVTRNDNLWNYELEFQGEEDKKGNIYKGTVVNIEPSLEAAFVDFGESKNGFLPLSEIPPAAAGVSEGGIAVGDQLLVQVKKDDIGSKGAGLTGYISLAGSFLVLMPYRSDASGISANLSAEQRQEINKVLKELPVPDGMSVIARSHATEQGREDIQWELERYLLPLWDAIKSARAQLKSPVLIYRENDLLLRVMRNYFRPDKGDVIFCDDKGRYDELHTFVQMLFPDNIEQIKFFDGTGTDSMMPVAVERQIEQIYMREVELPSGVRVVFDSTEALVAIDVNSGRQRDGKDIEETALKTNLEAAKVIAEQLRLRNLAGLIVIDFIDMRNAESNEAVESKMAQLLHKDYARTQYSKISKFGLMEISRQRISRSLQSLLMQPCPRCHGNGHIWREQQFALHLLRKLRVVAANKNARSFILQVPRETGMFLLNEKRAEIQQIEKDNNCDVIVVPNNHLESPNYKLKPSREKRDRSMQSAQKMVQEEEVAAEQYNRPAAKKQNVAALRNMLPQERPPSQEPSKAPGKEPGLWKRLLQNWFSAPVSEPVGGQKNSSSRRANENVKKSAGRPRGSSSSSSSSSGSGSGSGSRGGKSSHTKGQERERKNNQQKKHSNNAQPSAAAPSGAEANSSAAAAEQNKRKPAAQARAADKRQPSGKTPPTAPRRQPAAQARVADADKRQPSDKPHPTAPEAPQVSQQRPTAQARGADKRQPSGKPHPNTPQPPQRQAQSAPPAAITETVPPAPKTTQQTAQETEQHAHSATRVTPPASVSTTASTPTILPPITKTAAPVAAVTTGATADKSLAGASPSPEKSQQQAPSAAPSPASQPIVLPPITKAGDSPTATADAAVAPDKPTAAPAAANQQPSVAEKATAERATAKTASAATDWVVPEGTETGTVKEKNVFSPQERS